MPSRRGTRAVPGAGVGFMLGGNGDGEVPTVAEADGRPGEPGERLRVLVVAGHGLVAESLRFLLSAQGFGVATVVDSDTESATRALAATRPQVVVIGPVLGNGLEAPELIRAARADGAGVLILTTVGDRLRLA